MALRPVLLSALALSLLGCPVSGGEDDPTGDDDDAVSDPCEGIDPVVTELTVPELAKMMEAKDFELINVHVPYAGEIVDTDVHIPFTDTDALEAHLDGDLGAKAVLYCLTGPMSRQATADLAELGYCRIYDLPDGMTTWEYLGYPTTRPD